MHDLVAILAGRTYVFPGSLLMSCLESQHYSVLRRVARHYHQEYGEPGSHLV